ncbi:biotin transporter BioY [Sinirhodobacter sp. HNIBRBA609]|nr:biotin transporter BioY [Sinirhodobacter sp. HNIBRBA609]
MTLSKALVPSNAIVTRVAMVAVAGIAADRGVKSFVGLSVAGLIAGAALYVPGLAWPALVLGKSVPEPLSGWMMPFLAGDTVKAIISALIVSGGWSVLARRHA